MPLDHKQYWELYDALFNAYHDYDDFNQIIYRYINKKLKNYVPNTQAFSTVVQRVMDAAEQDGWTYALIDAAIKGRPSNQLLIDFINKYPNYDPFIDTEKRQDGGSLIFKRNPNGEVPKNSKTHKAAAPKIEKFVERRAPGTGKSYVEILIEDLKGEGGENVPALIGDVGVGKSAIVNEIVKRFADKEFKFIWSSAKKREYRLDDLLEDVLEGLLGEHSDLIEYFKQGLNQEIIRRKLQKSKTCFLVLDALEKVEPNDLKRCLEWVQKEIPNSTVVTSRCDQVYFNTRRIKEMTDSEAEEFVNNLKRNCSNVNHDAKKIIKKTNTKNPAVLRRAVELLEAEIDLENFNSGAGENADGKIDVKNLFKKVYDGIGKPANEILEALSKSPSPIGLDRKELIKISKLSDREDTFDNSIRKLTKFKFVLSRGDRFVLTESESQIQEMIEEFATKLQIDNAKEH